MKTSLRERDLLKAWAVSGLFSVGGFILSAELGATVGKVVEEGFGASAQLATISCCTVILGVGLGVSYLCFREFVPRLLGLRERTAHGV